MSDKNDTNDSPSSGGRSAFFYGTLMAPRVLYRVCNSGSSPGDPIHEPGDFQTFPAILHNHRRHRVMGVDYPALVPHEGATVRGTYVTGLTDNDIFRLDIFEGSSYDRVKVKARILTKVGDKDGNGNVEGDEVEAETYVWRDSMEALEDGEWDFAEFQREKMRFWVGAEAAGEYAEVDEAVADRDHDGTGGRGANGHITEALEEASKQVEKLRNAV